MPYGPDGAPEYRPVLVAVHYLIAVVGGFVLGIVPEISLEHFCERIGVGNFAPAYSPVVPIIGFLLGYFIGGRVLGAKVAKWTWTAGLAWLIFGIYFDDLRFWHASAATGSSRVLSVLADFFAPTRKCGNTECLYEIVYTIPFIVSVMYSIGAYLKRRQLMGAEKTLVYRHSN
ncbi:MAG TPA: hypothetical protein VFB28_04200 [Terriglobales bacterium]|nr:hypothetical protein [Terriglobales bacterium]